MKSKKYNNFARHAIGLACLALITSATHVNAAPISFSQSPPGSGGREPAPNVMVSVDDSGSMGQPGIDTLKNALAETFAASNIPDDKIRLAWQSMNGCPGIPSSSTSCSNKNVLKRLNGTHRSNFLTWVTTLTPNGGTPSHLMIKNVGDYLQRTNLTTNNPWGSNPGTEEEPVLSCRRAYNIFMTDGGWNSDTSDTRTHKDGNYISLGGGNSDGIARTLPDSTAYDPTSEYAKAYKDSWGSTTVSTLADLAHYYWATDLQPSIPNNVRSNIKKSGAELFDRGIPESTPFSLPEYWNPKNDPATWQHLVTYTIGFSSSTAADKDVTKWSGNPVWGTNTYDGDYSKLILGSVGWPSPLCKINLTTTTDTVGGNQACDGSNGYSARSNERKTELWHAAINGRGKFIPTKTSADLVNAFKEILDNIISDNSTPLTSISASSSSMQVGNLAYISGYSGSDWSGKVVARAINSTTAAIDATDTWNAATLLDASGYNLSNRLVLSYGTPTGSSADTGFSWTTWSTLPTAQKTPLGTNSSGTTDTNGQARVDYLRGDRTKEASNNGIFRSRGSRLGDIVNSNIWYTGKPSSGYSFSGYGAFRAVANPPSNTIGKGGRTPMVYVGGNDGMLHGFSASNWPAAPAATSITGGTELLAYIPQGIAQGNLRKLTDTSYSHQYFVDGDPFTGDAYIGSTPAWKTVLVGSLGAGGKGYFVLDVTDPANFTATNAANLVIKDTTASDSWATPDTDMGYITAPPVVDDAKSRQIVRMNDGRWAVVMGNGYNSTNEAPVLLIQYLDGDKSIKKVSPCTAPIATMACSFKGSNGLSAPQLIDLNGDGKIDVAYAGDLKGNVWKFDLTSTTPSDWTINIKGSSSNQQPLFIAKSSTGAVQPITTAPYWALHPKGGIMLVVGTGQNLTTADQTSTDKSSIYGIWDNSSYTFTTSSVTLTAPTAINTTTSTTRPATLVQQTISATTIVDSGITYYKSSKNAVDYTGSPPNKRGWYLDYIIDGQRVLQNPSYFSAQQVQVLSSIPRSGGSSTGETCTPTSTPERSFLTVLNLFSGSPSASPVFLLSTTTLENKDNANVTGVEISPGGVSKRLRNNDQQFFGNPNGNGANGIKAVLPKYIGARANWREIQN
jgi:type IV pilus assembly protein PilY1